MSDELPKRSEVSDAEANPYRRDPAKRVRVPGTLLVVVGCLGIAANLMLVVFPNALRDRGSVRRPPGMNDSAFESYKRSRTAPLMDYLLPAPPFAVYSLVIFAGARMRQLRSRGLAITGAFLAMLPCSLVIVFGIPVGIWSLIVLANPAVTEAFAIPRRTGA